MNLENVYTIVIRYNIDFIICIARFCNFIIYYLYPKYCNNNLNVA